MATSEEEDAAADEERRRKEMSMFAAFASGDNGTSNESGAASGSEDNDADDAVFVDDANQQSHSIVEDTTAMHTNTKAVEAKQALEASLLARRQRGGASGSEGKARVAPPVTVSSLSSGGGLTPVAEKSAFAAAASGSLSFNSGTFVEEQMSSRKQKTPGKKNANLEAAAASLASLQTSHDQPSPTWPSSSIAPSSEPREMMGHHLDGGLSPPSRDYTQVPPPQPPIIVHNTQQQPQHPIHMERILLPKPRFFGPTVPPRALEVAQKAAQEAAKAAIAAGCPHKFPKPLETTTTPHDLIRSPSRMHQSDDGTSSEVLSLSLTAGSPPRHKGPSSNGGDSTAATSTPTSTSSSLANSLARPLALLRVSSTGSASSLVDYTSPDEAGTSPDSSKRGRRRRRGSPKKMISSSSPPPLTVVTAPKPVVPLLPEVERHYINLAPQYRNLEGALEVFGAPIYPPSRQKASFEESYYVSTYQPVFGDVARSIREKRRMAKEEQQRPNTKSPETKEEPPPVTVSSTSPVRVVDPMKAVLSPKRSLSSTKSLVSTPEQDMFSKWALADNVGGGTFVAEETSSSSTKNKSPDGDKVKAEAPDPNLFSQWALGGDAAGGGSFIAESLSNPKETSEQKPPSDKDVETNDSPEGAPISDRNLFSQWARGDDVTEGGTFVGEPSKKKEGTEKPKDEEPMMSDQSLFSRWAQQGSEGQESSAEDGRSSGDAYSSGTFLPAVSDSSFVGSELKKKVGMNANLSAALASLAEEGDESGSGTAGNDSNVGDASNVIANQNATTSGGRPLTNLELTSGRVPLFGCDDTPLPIEADLGIFETKEDQTRSAERRRSQEIIENQAVPNIYGTLVCPNPCRSADDSQNWNSRNAMPSGPLGRNNNRPTASTPKSQETSPDSEKAGSPKMKSREEINNTLPVRPPPTVDSGTRYGWWNVPEESKTETSPTEFPMQLASLEPIALDVNTRLEPSPEKLRDENMPLSNLHAATSTANALPFLSDRPPSFRYVQVDAQAVGFPQLGGEIEPLFCTLAIYHVEADMSGVGGSGGSQSTPTTPGAAPAANLRRCGRVTEALSFDVVTDPDIEARCCAALWPFANGVDPLVPPLPPKQRGSPLGFVNSSKSSKDANSSVFPAGERTQSTRCGVFPLPSNLNVSNLYAVLIVHKVLADYSEVDVYMKSSRRSQNADGGGKSSSKTGDISKYRSKAEKSSERLGQFLMPFAFGVAPLLQVIGPNIPMVPTSRAVQIPLFKLVAGKGDQPIIDHIMVMLYPRADHSRNGGGPAELTKGGQAMLVMRHFGYLGLHSAINTKSSLARDRLVDFTGDLQVRRRNEKENAEIKRFENDQDDGRTFIVPSWHHNFLSEPTMYGGRNVVKQRRAGKIPSSPLGRSSSYPSNSEHDDDGSTSSLYAQELAHVPLSLTPPPRGTSKMGAEPSRGGRPQRGNQTGDVEPYFYTSFCNQLLCQPRILHNASKRNVVIKVEVREIKWLAGVNTYIALPPEDGPSIQNSRRGPCLVREAYSSCAYHAVDPQFLDEFKIKLPLLLKNKVIGGGINAGRLALLFSVYNINVRVKKKWSERIASKGGRAKAVLTRKGGSSSDLGDDASIVEEEDDEKKSSSSPTEFVGCGFLPLTMELNTTSLVANGLYDVKIKYLSRPAPPTIEISESSGNTKDLFPYGSSRSLKSTGSVKTHRSTGSSRSITSIESTPSGSSRRKKKFSIPEGSLILDLKSDFRTSRSTDTSGRDNQHLNESENGVAPKRSESFASEADSSAGRSSKDIAHNLSHGDRDSSPTSSVTSAANSVASRTSKDSRHFRSSSNTVIVEESMNLQVRCVFHSSVHPQNAALAKFFMQRPTPPRALTEKEITSPTEPWQLKREEMVAFLDPERAPKWNNSDALLAEKQQNLLKPTVDISRSSACPPSEVSSHFLRIISQLFRAVVSGTGDPSFEWANPASFVPLRLYSFTSLLHVLSSTTAFMSKNGVTQLDGKSKWNLTSMGRVVAILFDEENLFGGPLEPCLEARDDELVPDSLSLTMEDTKSPGKTGEGVSPTGRQRRGHARNAFLPLSTAPLHTQSLSPTSLSPKSYQLSAKDSDQNLNDIVSKSMIEEEGVSAKETKAEPIKPFPLLPLELRRGKTMPKEMEESRPMAMSEKSRSYSDDDSTVSAFSSASSNGAFKMDSKADFQSALNAASSTSDDGFATVKPSPAASLSGSRAAMNMIGAFGGLSNNTGPAANRRRWMTAPSSALATIREDQDAIENKDTPERINAPQPWSSPGNESSESDSTSSVPDSPTKSVDALDTELVLRAKATKAAPVKQMRVPRVHTIGGSVTDNATIDIAATPTLSLIDTNVTKEENFISPTNSTGSTIPTTDEEIESAGTAFLDVIGKNLGYKTLGKETSGEEMRVGHAHHRKTRSRCSIDWTLPPADLLMENQQQLEHINRRKLNFGVQSSIVPGPERNKLDGGFEGAIDDPTTTTRQSNEDSDYKIGLDRMKSLESAKREHEGSQLEGTETDSISSHGRDNRSAGNERPTAIILPGFLDRLSTLRKRGECGRWYPYAYEVIIFQWVAILVEQTKSGEQKRNSGSHGVRPSSSTMPQKTNKYLVDAAQKARGVTIGCAPILFEVIKKSLGWRLDTVFRHLKARDNKGKPGSHTSRPNVIPLVSLDETIIENLEELIQMVTDACIDSRNFDSWQFRQTSIDVNDAIVRFLRDLFAFLDPKIVHRLILVYFSRFVMKEGKHWQDRDSKIGLRCSWETCKLRLNAATLLMRFPDFIRVNKPLMETWGNWPLSAPVALTRNFFDESLEILETLSLSKFAATEGPVRKAAVEIPEFKSHWLAELVTDICLSATGHAEQNIQHRAGSLLHELFWMQSQEAKANGSQSVVASMYVPCMVKIFGQLSYLSSLPPKSQLRKDLLPCVVFVLQSAPVGLMRALWRKLCRRALGQGDLHKYGGIGSAFVRASYDDQSNTTPEGFGNMYDGNEEAHLPNILDVFSLLNLILKTFEYEGSERNVDEDIDDGNTDQRAQWRKEFLLAEEQNGYANLSMRPRNSSLLSERENSDKTPPYSTSSSRKWLSHDGAIVVISTTRHIVREMLFMVRPSDESVIAPSAASPSISIAKRLSLGFPDLHPTGEKTQTHGTEASKLLKFSFADTVIFVRGTTSVYLHALALRQSDVVVIKTLVAAVEIVKIFGIKLFLAAVGETLQHWMRVVVVHCGSRRAEVRVQALEFLALILRLTWDSFGSFFRIRVPLLSVQTEVMERLVATAATRFYREQRKIGTVVQYLGNDGAEAVLSPMWRTLDRLQHQSASQNVAFRSALTRLAEMMKKLYRAYIAAHALAIVNRSRSIASPTNSMIEEHETYEQSSALMQNSRVCVHRIVAASAGFSKQFLGLHGASSHREVVTHNEAVEDAFLAAADVFSTTELPSHRVAWLRKLAEFYSSRSKYAEEATCRFQIHNTLRQAARLHDSLWNSVPFLPWTSDSSDGVHLDGEGPAGEPGEYYGADYDIEDIDTDDFESVEMASGRQIEKSNSFRRIFYRVANSVRMRTGDWDVGGNKNLFYGVTFPSEYTALSTWISLREMEEDMVEEAETAGDLYLKAGIVESSRYSWSLATQFYSETFNYVRLAYVYRRLALVVASQVPVVDTSNQLELSSPLGRFYRVWFHGGAPDELIGSEFVYRASGSQKLGQFGEQLCEMLRSILPDKTPIDLVLDDGRPEDQNQRRNNQRRPLGAAPLQPVKIKVTPLRPLIKNEKHIRGTPEWFYGQTAFAGFSVPPAIQSLSGSSGTRRAGHGHGDGDTVASSRFGTSPRHRSSNDSRSVSRTFVTTNSAGMRSSNSMSQFAGGGSEVRGETSIIGGGKLMGVDKFSFTQPIQKNRQRGSRDWLKAPSGDFAEKSLRVTQLQVEQLFPACVSRQEVVHRSVFTQSPLEAGAEAVCSWCAVLFRTAVATNGAAVIGDQKEQAGIGTSAAKVVADCIHSSRVKEMGHALLNKNLYVAEEDDGGEGSMMFMYEKLTEEEIAKHQTRLARAIVIFMELIHLLVARNRDLLLAVVQTRKSRGDSSIGTPGYSNVRGVNGQSRSASVGFVSSPENQRPENQRFHQRHTSNRSTYSAPGTGAASTSSHDGHSRGGYHDEGGNSVTGGGSVSSMGGNDRTDSAIPVQSELQRAFIAMAKALYPMISGIINSETPRWLKSCCQDNYFSSGVYRQTRISMGEDLFFFSDGDIQAQDDDRTSHRSDYGIPLSIVPSDPSASVHRNTESPNGSYCGSTTSRNSEPFRGHQNHHHHNSRPSPTQSLSGMQNN